MLGSGHVSCVWLRRIRHGVLRQRSNSDDGAKLVGGDPTLACRMVESSELTYQSAPGGGDPSAREAVERFIEEQAAYLPDGRVEQLPGGDWAKFTEAGQVVAVFRVGEQSPGHYFVTGFDKCAGT